MSATRLLVDPFEAVPDLSVRNVHSGPLTPRAIRSLQQQEKCHARRQEQGRRTGPEASVG
jgi:hypothetical protein